MTLPSRAGCDEPLRLTGLYADLDTISTGYRQMTEAEMRAELDKVKYAYVFLRHQGT